MSQGLNGPQRPKKIFTIWPFMDNVCRLQTWAGGWGGGGLHSRSTLKAELQIC